MSGTVPVAPDERSDMDYLNEKFYIDELVVKTSDSKGSIRIIPMCNPNNSMIHYSTSHFCQPIGKDSKAHKLKIILRKSFKI